MLSFGYLAIQLIVKCEHFLSRFGDFKIKRLSVSLFTVWKATQVLKLKKKQSVSNMEITKHLILCKIPFANVDYHAHL